MAISNRLKIRFVRLDETSACLNNPNLVAAEMATAEVSDERSSHEYCGLTD